MMMFNETLANIGTCLIGLLLGRWNNKLRDHLHSRTFSPGELLQRLSLCIEELYHRHQVTYPFSHESLMSQAKSIISIRVRFQTLVSYLRNQFYRLLDV